MWVSRKRFESLEKELDYLKGSRYGGVYTDYNEPTLASLYTMYKAGPSLIYLNGSKMEKIKFGEALEQIIDHLGLELEVTPATGEVRKLVKRRKKK